MVSYEGRNDFAGAKIAQIERKTKLMGNFLLKIVELCLSIVAITEQSCANALPIATSHRECLACRNEVFTIDAIGKLMAILLAIVCHTKPDLSKFSLLYQLPLSTSLDIYTVFT